MELDAFREKIKRFDIHPRNNQLSISCGPTSSGCRLPTKDDDTKVLITETMYTKNGKDCNTNLLRHHENHVDFRTCDPSVA